MIQVRHLTKNYGDKLALDDVGFTVDTCMTVGLLGLNGAGKSTLMNILTGYVGATSGDVALCGRSISEGGGSEAKRVVGYLPEQPAFYPDMRVCEHLNFVCRLKNFGKNKNERDAHIADVCRRAGVESVADRMIRNLSKGYRQRVGFAQALIGNPRVLILDEPTAGLDPSQIRETRKLIKDFGRDGVVVMSSHILQEARAVCDRIILLNKGRVVADGAPGRIAACIDADAGVRRVKIRVKGAPDQVAAALSGIRGINAFERKSDVEPGACDFLVSSRDGYDPRDEIFGAFAKNGLPIVMMAESTNTLEDMFLRLTGAEQDVDDVYDSGAEQDVIDAYDSGAEQNVIDVYDSGAEQDVVDAHDSGAGGAGGPI